MTDTVAEFAKTTELTTPQGEKDEWLSIRPSSGWSALNLKEVWNFRDLILTLASRDLKLRYKQTALGVIWVVLQPLMAAGIFSFVFGKVAKLSSEGVVSYFVFAFAGQLGWNLFSNTVSKAGSCLVGNAHLISKVFFPRLVLPLATVPSTMVDFGVAAAMMAGLLVMYRINPGVGLLFLPLWILALLAMALGIGLITSALSVSYRDIQYIVPVFMQMLMYISPVAYGVASVPAWARVYYYLNPISPVLEGFRWSLLGTNPPNWAYVSYSCLLAVFLFVAGAFSFKRMERKFADVI